jgi:hypothetical protein
MSVIDVEALSIEEVEASEEETLQRLDEICRDLFNMSADDFIAAVRDGRPVDHPAAARLGVLAEAFI